MHISGPLAAMSVAALQNTEHGDCQRESGGEMVDERQAEALVAAPVKHCG